jgi:FkbM family methyltransferase
MHTPIGEIITRNTYDEDVVKEVIIDHGYERWGNIEITGKVLDCGAHIGSFSALALSLGCTVTAVEPEPHNFALLEMNAPGATLINCAISNNPTEKFYVDPERSELNKIAEDGITVDCVTLDQLITGYIDLLKMDIEGAEYDALYTCHRLKYVRQITMEYHNGLGKLGKLCSFLEKNGFKFGWIGGQAFGHLQVKRI